MTNAANVFANNAREENGMDIGRIIDNQANEIERLRAENDRLRAALQRIADIDVEPDIIDAANMLAGIAWAALQPTPGRKTG